MYKCICNAHTHAHTHAQQVLRTSLSRPSSQETTLKERSSELSKAQDELSSLNVKLKWAQNKLKAETEEHSSCKAKLQNMAKKWKEAKEEGDQLRAELKATVQTYQVSHQGCVCGGWRRRGCGQGCGCSVGCKCVLRPLRTCGVCCIGRCVYTA